jgi:hypothetical protein
MFILHASSSTSNHLLHQQVILLNTAVDFVQARKSAAMLKSLGDLAPPKALCLRDGGAVEISARNLVRGDVLLLSSGDKASGLSNRSLSQLLGCILSRFCAHCRISRRVYWPNMLFAMSALLC